MKKLFITATLIMAMMSVCSYAATNDSISNQRKQRGSYPPEEMIKELNLTDQQVSDLKAGEANLREQMKQMREEEKNESKEAKEEQREKIDKVKQARLELMKKVLNSDQYVKFLEDEYVKQSPNRMMFRQMNGNFGGGQQGGFGGGRFGGGQGGPQE